MTETTRTEPGRMMIGKDRLFYDGLLGNSMRPRKLGALSIYVATDDYFEVSLDGGATMEKRRMIALDPFTSHLLKAPSGSILNLCLEPESIDKTALQEFVADVNGPENAHFARKVREGQAMIASGTCTSGFDSSDFDRFFFGKPLPKRRVDPRISKALERLSSANQEQEISASDCAGEVGLSTSRFLHLFKETTDIPFRSQRMWKRARRFMDYANRDDSLTEVALELGYPDSSHFSHSIRASFGLQPRSIRQGSRGLELSLGAGYQISTGYAA